jgi:pimeloyl-ACP methyl ester carboxylesterase
MTVIALALLLLIAALLAFSGWKSQTILRDNPNTGQRIDIGGYRMNALHLPKPAGADLPALVFVHGASGNLRDQEHAFRPRLEGRAEMLFVDRPGHGYSERGGPENDFPDGQADAIATLMEKLGIARAIIVGHSFGGAIVASFAVRHPDKLAGLLFLAPATHPWPGGVDWYYDVAANRWLGWLFSRAIALPAGLSRLDGGTRSVFRPNRRPDDYIEATSPALVLRPKTFRYNAIDVANLNGFVARMQPRYQEITAPTVIITGDRDDVVAEEIHSRGLARDIAGSELVWIHNLGHKPDYIVTDIAIAALEKISGQNRDLQAMARQAETRIASDDF